jgi:hypothetical protein
VSDIVNTLRGGFCEPNTGCMSIRMCICDLLGDAADEIERLRNMVDHHEHSLQEAHAEIERLRGMVMDLSGSASIPDALWGEVAS